MESAVKCSAEQRCLTCCWRLAVATGPVRERGVWPVCKYWTQFWRLWRSFLGQKLSKVGRKKRLEVVPYGRNQGVLYLDGSQFIHSYYHFVSKIKKNVSITQHFSCDSVFEWHLGTKILTKMNASNDFKWFFYQKSSMSISGTKFWINCVKIGKFTLVCTEYIDHTSLRFLSISLTFTKVWFKKILEILNAQIFYMFSIRC